MGDGGRPELGQQGRGGQTGKGRKNRKWWSPQISAGTDSRSKGSTCAQWATGSWPGSSAQPDSPKTKTMSSARPSLVPWSEVQGESGPLQPTREHLACLRPRQLRLLGICPRRPHTQGTCHARPQQPADCVSVPLTSDPASKRQGRSCPNSPQGPASQRAEYKLAKKSSNLEYYKCSLYFRNCGSGHWVPWCSQKFLLQIHPGTVPISPDPVGLTRASLGDTDPGRGAGAWAPGMGPCPSKPPQPSQGSHARPRPAHQPPAGPLQSLGVHEMRQADAILLF